MMHDSDGKPSAAWALTTASTTSERSPGVMTATPSVQPLQHVLGGHARDQHVHRLAVQQLLVAADQRAFDGIAQVADRRRDEQRLLGQHVGLRFERFSASATAVICDGSQRLATTAAVCACWPADLDEAQLDDLSDLRRACGPWP